jgi:Uncharacterised protein family (UPF0158)
MWKILYVAPIVVQPLISTTPVKGLPRLTPKLPSPVLSLNAPGTSYNAVRPESVCFAGALDAMSTVISLREVISAVVGASDECTSFLDPETGEIILVTEEERALAEDESWERAPAWQRELMPKIRAALEGDRWLELPDRFDIHEWSIMERFSRAQKIERIRSGLLNAIQGAGAFRAFRSAIYGLGLEQSWYQFRDQALADIARSWLEEHQLEYK